MSIGVSSEKYTSGLTPILLSFVVRAQLYRHFPVDAAGV
jgi:hypothetical protein